MGQEAHFTTQKGGLWPTRNQGLDEFKLVPLPIIESTKEQDDSILNHRLSTMLQVFVSHTTLRNENRSSLMNSFHQLVGR